MKRTVIASLALLLLACAGGGAPQRRPTAPAKAAPAPGQPAAPDPGGARAGLGFTSAATPAAALETLPGFRVELLYSVPRDTQGSWVALTLDDKGRLIASPQNQRGLYRITPPPLGGPPDATKVEALDVEVGHAQGLLHAFGSLYVVVAEAKDDNGLYRLTDSDGDDRYDKTEKLLALRGHGEHGPHGIVLSPDRQSIYLVAGNYTKLPDGIKVHRSPAVWAEDHLLPPVKDPVGWKRQSGAGGYVLQLDRDGHPIELHTVGLRNAYDIAWNRYGDLFTYDSDMEWDLGTSWYRPPRICLLASGGEFGWRFSTGKWPAYFADSLGPLLDTGPSSPTGVVFGYGTRFPPKYQEALYVLDWTYGTIHAVHLVPEGAAYRAHIEPFVSGQPLPVTDAVVHGDGTLYFITGGRNVQSGVYRVSHTGAARAEALPFDENAAELRSIRHRLESFHGRVDPAAVAAAWPYLGHPDRFLRHAARVALEHQPVKGWHKRALALKEPGALITATIALARHADRRAQAAAVRALGALDFAKLSDNQRVELLRAYALVFIRLAAPSRTQARSLADKLQVHYPANDDRVNVELARVLAYLEAPSVVEKTVALMESARAADTGGLAALAARNEYYGASVRDMVAKSPQTQRMLLASLIRGVKAGWTPALRRRYFRLIDQAMASSSGGNFYLGGWQMIREEALARLSPAERTQLGALALEPARPDGELELPQAQGPGETWTVFGVWERIEKDPRSLRGRNFDNGKKMFSAATCVLCHRLGSEGGTVGPDLSSGGQRFSMRDLLDAIINPSAVVSDQYQAALVTRKDGQIVAGRLIREDDQEVVLMPNMFKPQELVAVPRAEVATVEPSPSSQMPPGLVNNLNWDELMDLLAYLLSNGNPQHAAFD